MMDPKLKQAYSPRSHYKETFRPLHYQPVERRGLAVPAQVIPESAPARCMDLLTMTQKDFVQKPINLVEKFKIQNNLKTPKSAFDDCTSYKCDFQTRRSVPSLTSKTLMRTTMPRIVEVRPDENYLTTNQCTLRRWRGDNPSISYKEVQEPPFFSGEFQKDTVSAADFSASAVVGGRPSTNCKRPAKREALACFNGSTTNKAVYKLPAISERDPVCMKGRSQVMEETMAPTCGKMESLTQYRWDNPGFYFKTSRRSVPPPYMDKLALFDGKLDDKSEHVTSFKEPPLSSKVSAHHTVACLMDSIRSMKFLKTTPRPLNSDSSDRIYHPAVGRSEVESETRRSFPPSTGKAPKAFLSLDERFGNKKGAKYSEKLLDETAYRSDFKPRPFPKAVPCPVESTLKGV